MKLKDKLINFPIVSTAVSFVFLIIIGYFIFIPAIRQYMALSESIKNKEFDLALVETSNKQYAVLKENIKNHELELDNLKNRLFWDRDISKFLNELTRLASDLQIEFVSLKPQVPALVLEKDIKEPKDIQQQDSMINVPIEVSFRSSYNSFIAFLKRIEEGEKFIKIDALAVESHPNNIYKHSVRMGLNILIEK